MDRPVLVHYHIFKNAGTSVDAALESSFGSRWTTFEGTHAHDVQTSEQLARFLHAHPDVIAVSSHLARPPLPAGCHPVVFLRHPILRARSVYEHTRRDPDAYGSEHAQESFADYITWALDGGSGGIVIRDYQVVHLSDASFRTHILDTQATGADLDQAKALIKGWGPGIVEHYDRSVARFQQRYKPTFWALNFSPTWLNRTHEPRDVAEELDAIRDELGHCLFGRLAAANRLDLSLWTYAGGV